jgi:hypothetical protein
VRGGKIKKVAQASCAEFHGGFNGACSEAVAEKNERGVCHLIFNIATSQIACLRTLPSPTQFVLLSTAYQAKARFSLPRKPSKLPTCMPQLESLQPAPVCQTTPALLIISGLVQWLCSLAPFVHLEFGWCICTAVSTYV